MIKLTNKTAVLLSLALASASTIARENIGVAQKSHAASTVLANNCTQSTHHEVLNVNNVRTTMRGGGDFWWDGQFAKYEIPANSGKHSVYAGSIWIGGLTNTGNLKVAAMTYRQTGIDYWPGPLDSRQDIYDEVTGTDVPNLNYGQTNIDVCTDYNTHFKVSVKEVQEYVSACNKGGEDLSSYTNIINWPGNGVNNELDVMLAPFVDLDDDGIYEPDAPNCEYPAYDLQNSGDCLAKDILFGDETIFWVFNDRGNIHTESGSESIGIEIQAQAFGFTTNDEINDMTFYNYKILNRSVETLNKTFFGTWVDSDVGYFNDDYVGCDVARGLGYTYNGDEDDEGTTGYGANPPALGMDFFRGPVADANDGVDNDKDGCIDCTYGVDADGNQIEIDDDATPELIIMSKFMFYNNDRTALKGNPEVTSDFYNYLSGRWRTGQPVTFGADGADPSNPECDYMFPGDTDPAFPGENWTEESAGNPPADRRFLITAGPFTLEPGAVNTITTGLVWARANTGGAFASVEKMRVADDKAQALFDNCFKVLNGPDAPDLTIDSYDKKFIITISNDTTPGNSNNAFDKYEEVDPTLIGTAAFPIENNKYVFEGYQIFQLADKNVTASDLYNDDKARLIHWSDKINFRADKDGNIDLSNGIGRLINYEKNEELNAFVPVDKTLQADNKGIKHSFVVTNDAFAQGDAKLVNTKSYYFMAIAYGFNEYMPYAPDVPFDDNIYIPNSDGQKYPYKAGRRNIKVYEARPYLKTGDLTGDYGTVPAMTRIQGNGSNGNVLEFTSETEMKLATDFCAEEVTYKENMGPVNIYVVDPSNVQKAKYQFQILPETDTTVQITDHSTWILIQNPGTVDADTISSSEAVGANYEQIIPQWGLAVDVNINSEQPVISRLGDNGYISSSIDHEDPTDPWLTFFQDADNPNFGNWILSGNQQVKNPDGENSYDDFFVIDAIINNLDEQPTPYADPKGIYENIINGGWAPYALTSPHSGFPQYDGSYIVDAINLGDDNKSLRDSSNLVNLPSIKVVFTPNKDLWTRVPVINTESGNLSLSDQKLMRYSKSVDKEGNDDGSGFGFSWFPGYALDKTSGMRLNMMFGENVTDTANNGDDMMFNPTHTVTGDNFDVTFDANGNRVYSNASLGGGHYIYVCNSKYNGSDETLNPDYGHFKEVIDRIEADRNIGKLFIKRMFKSVVWSAIPLRIEGKEMNISDIAVNIDISQPFTSWTNSSELQACSSSDINNSFPLYNFSTDSLAITNVVEDKDFSSVLDLVGIVPNPYYGGSSLETDPLDHRVRITNLPKKSIVSIYTVDGVLIRQIKVDEGRDFDWDLKNTNGISIASGVYIFHVKSPEGERTIKWFGSLRPIDLDKY